MITHHLPHLNRFHLPTSGSTTRILALSARARARIPLPSSSPRSHSTLPCGGRCKWNHLQNPSILKPWLKQVDGWRAQGSWSSATAKSTATGRDRLQCWHHHSLAMWLCVTHVSSVTLQSSSPSKGTLAYGQLRADTSTNKTTLATHLAKCLGQRALNKPEPL